MEVFLKELFLIIIYLLLGKKNLPGHNVRPKLKFRRTWADFSRTLSDDRLLFAALRHMFSPTCFALLSTSLR